MTNPPLRRCLPAAALTPFSVLMDSGGTGYLFISVRTRLSGHFAHVAARWGSTAGALLVMCLISVAFLPKIHSEINIFEWGICLRQAAKARATANAEAKPSDDDEDSDNDSDEDEAAPAAKPAAKKAAAKVRRPIAAPPRLSA